MAEGVNILFTPDAIRIFKGSEIAVVTFFYTEWYVEVKSTWLSCHRRV